MVAAEAVVTFDRPDGFRVVKNLGLARGEAICQRNILRATFRTIGAFIGFTPVEYLTDAERARAESLVALRGNAAQLGANGIVGVQFDSREQTDGSTRVIVTGQAVILEPETPGAP